MQQQPYHLLWPFVFAIIVTALLIPVWISACKKWGLFDEPDSRKHHRVITPSMGGIAIFAGLFCSYLAFADIADHNKLRYLFAGSLVLFFTGFFDDLLNVRPQKKLIMQTISILVIFYGGYRLPAIEMIPGTGTLPAYLTLALTLIAALVFINAYNFIDGIDGLAGSLGVIASSCMGALFFYYNKPDFAIFAFCITGALMAFLFYNFYPAKIFMGDTGSLVVGFLLIALGIELLQTGAKNSVIAVPPTFILALLFVPLYDFCRVVCWRLFHGTSPFKADRNHLHHMILMHGFGHRSTTLIVSAFALLIISLHQLFADLTALEFISISIMLSLLLFNNVSLAALSRIRTLFFSGNSAVETNRG